ncbi:alpha-amylase family glycosyl hydrolase [uncultured Dokdonia sp.]|uniref:alpha-amylase family glycosyl hydrolase n=1 Tax=uncultured Dokdonia sp. TaxID=575653 RepID=UPI00262249E3|nr:alpha-amylase family glycosyl hydrolase [uncultured Dokdonia sp.]
MKNYTLYPLFLLLFLVSACKEEKKEDSTKGIEEEEDVVTTPFLWEASNMYFLLTDRFNNGDPTNDIHFDRSKKTAVLRGFEGGDLKGIKDKIQEGYFNELGINALWFTPVVEQVHGAVDEGTGVTYGYHGYWAKDWTQLDPNFGTMDDLKDVVDAAHAAGIRIVMDVVLNHTGPVTDQDPFWGTDWAREDPNCKFSTYENTTACSLVENLPDILTESTTEVELPKLLIEKWKAEGRYEQEMNELTAFFTENKYKKTPRNYIIKWLTDYVRELGIDAYRVDTAKHVDEASWVVLREEADKAFAAYKKAHPDKVLDDTDFFMLGEVYNYSVDGGRSFDFGDGTKVDYFANGFDNLINFQFKYDAQGDYEALFAKYDSINRSSHKEVSITNYATSHDDGQPFDVTREKAKETGTKLILTPGISQIYYGDESARNLVIEGTQGDATLRSFMNWEDQKNSPETKEILKHWRKLGQFRANHPAIGAGKHTMISNKPYIFNRHLTIGEYTDHVMIGLNLPFGKKEFQVDEAFAKAEYLIETYSKQKVRVINGKVSFSSPFDIALLEKGK